MKLSTGPRQTGQRTLSSWNNCNEQASQRQKWWQGAHSWVGRASKHIMHGGTLSCALSSTLLLLLLLPWPLWRRCWEASLSRCSCAHCKKILSFAERTSPAARRRSHQVVKDSPTASPQVEARSPNFQEGSKGQSSAQNKPSTWAHIGSVSCLGKGELLQGLWTSGCLTMLSMLVTAIFTT